MGTRKSKEWSLFVYIEDTEQRNVTVFAMKNVADSFYIS